MYNEFDYILLLCMEYRMSYFRTFGYETFKLFVTQFVMAIFGLMVMSALATSGIWLFVASIAAALLYCFLVYSQLWEIGGSDRLKVDAGRAQKDLTKPLLMALIANTPSLLLGLLEVIGYLAKLSSLQSVSHAIGLFLQSYLIGIINFLGLKGNPFTLILIPFISIFVTFLSYLCGYAGIVILPTSKKQEKKLKK